MLKSRNVRLVLASTVLFSSAALVAQDQPADFYFGGKRIFVGMGQAEALAAISTCCKLSPPSLTDAERRNGAVAGSTIGQFIVQKEESTPRILGTVFFEGGKVTSVTRPLGEEAYLPWNEDVLGFARTLQRALSPRTGDSDTTVHISVRHERATNAETEMLSLSFPSGRGVRVNIVRLDKPFEGAPPDSREQVNLEEFLERPRRP